MTAPTERALCDEHVQAVLRAITDMRQHMGDHRQLSDLAHASLYSPWHFHRIFYRVTHTTPARFLAALRMEQAKHLLASSDQTVTLISSSVGYESLGTFTSRFNRLVGVSPGAFRRLVDRAAGLDIRPSLCAAALGAGPRVELQASAEITHQVGAVIGLFRVDLPQGPLGAFATLDETLRGRLQACPGPGTYEVFALTLTESTQLVDLALGTAPGACVGHVQARLTTSTHADAPIVVGLRPPLLIDPPVVSSAAAIHLLQLPRC